VEDTLAVLAGCLGEVVVGRSAAEVLRKSSLKDSLAVDERGGVGVACSCCARSAALGFFQVWQGCGRSAWVRLIPVVSAEHGGVSLRERRRYCSGEAVVEEWEVEVWCVGGEVCGW
jgi:hypothetical protein